MPFQIILKTYTYLESTFTFVPWYHGVPWCPAMGVGLDDI